MVVCVAICSVTVEKTVFSVYWGWDPLGHGYLQVSRQWGQPEGPQERSVGSDPPDEGQSPKVERRCHREEYLKVGRISTWYFFSPDFWVMPVLVLCPVGEKMPWWVT